PCPGRILSEHTILSIEMCGRTRPSAFGEILPVVLLTTWKIDLRIGPLRDGRHAVSLNLAFEPVTFGPLVKRTGESVHEQVCDGFPVVKPDVRSACIAGIEQKRIKGPQVVTAPLLESRRKVGCPVG